MNEMPVAPEHEDPSRASHELAMHGMLEFLAHHTPQRRRARIDAAMLAIAATQLDQPRHPWLSVRRLLPLATAACIGIAAVFSWTASPPSAQAQVDAAIHAQRIGTDRTYDIRVLALESDRPEHAPGAVVDVRSPDLLVISHTPPHVTVPIVVGRDNTGEWAIDHDGAVVRDSAEDYFPPWRLSGNTPVVDSLDRILDRISHNFDLHTNEPATLTDGGPRFIHISATRRSGHEEFPDTVQLWLHPSTHILERMEMRWQTRSSSARHRPPALILIGRVDAPPLPDDWFTADAHRTSR